MLFRLRKSLRKKRIKLALYRKAFLFFVKLYKLRLKFPSRPIVLIGLYEHIGDIIGAEPVIGYARRKYENGIVVWATNASYSELLEHHPGLDDIINLNSFSEWIFLKKVSSFFPFQFLHIIDLHLGVKVCSKYKFELHKDNHGIDRHNYLDNGGILQAFSIAAGIDELTEGPTFYLDVNKRVLNLPEKYMVFHTHTNHYMKDWSAGKWVELSKAMISAGYAVIEVGLKKQIDLDDSNYIDYTGKRSLQLIGNIIYGADFFIGLDSSFAHMANALNKDGLILIGQYKIEERTFDRYNPFTGKYSNEEYIVYSADGSLQSLQTEEVIERVMEKVLITDSEQYK